MISQFKTGYHVNYIQDNYSNNSIPTLFIEPSSPNDWGILFLHKTFKAVLWSQISWDNKPDLNKIKKQKNLVNICFQESISQKLEKENINNFFLPNFLKLFFNKPIESSKSLSHTELKEIFLDLPPNESKFINEYKKLVMKFPELKFYINHSLHKKYPQLTKLFNVKPIFIFAPEDIPYNTFLIINLDGPLSTISSQFGNQNKKTISNEKSSYSLPFSNLSDICAHITNSLNPELSFNKELSIPLDELEKYFDIEFYDFPYQKQHNITWIKDNTDNWKIINNSDKNHPGIYLKKYLMKGNLYLIKVKGYYPSGQIGNVKLWIARENYFQKNKKDTILLKDELNLSSREDGFLQYLFHNDEIEDTYYFGLLFEDADKMNYFILESLDIKCVN